MTDPKITSAFAAAPSGSSNDGDVESLADRLSSLDLTYFLDQEKDEKESVLVNDKGYKRSRHAFRSNKRKAHKKNSKALVLKHHRKKNAKKSKKGFRPESDEVENFVSKYLTKRNLENISSSDYVPSEQEKQLFVTLQETFASHGGGESERVLKTVTQVLCYLGSLTQCSSWLQVTAATSQLVSGLLPPSVYRAVLNKITIEPQSDDDGFFSDFVSKMREARLTMVGLSSVPCIKQISRVVTLVTLAGLTPAYVKDSEFLSNALDMWTKRVTAGGIWDNFLELFVGSIEFCGEFLLAWKSKTFDKLLMPSDIHSRCTGLLALKDVIARGQLDSTVGKTNEQVFEEVVDCLRDVERLVKSPGVPAPEKFALSRYSRELLDLKYFIEFIDSENKLREEPSAVLFYGPAGIGKSGMIFSTLRLLSARYGFACKDENIWYPGKGDEFDSGYNGRITTIIEDDIANEKKEFITGSSVYDFLRYVNIVPAVSVQADLEKKGRINFKPKCVIGTTNNERINTEHFAISQVAHLRRVVFVEVRVKPQYQKTFVNSKNREVQTDRLDIDKYDGDPDDPFQELHEYRIINWVQNHGAANADKVEGDWMDMEHGLKAIIKECDARRINCKTYIDTIQRIRDAELCEKCHFPPKWCECVCECEPEFGETFFHMITPNQVMHRVLLHILWRFAPSTVFRGRITDFLMTNLMRVLMYGARIIGRNYVIRCIALNILSSFIMLIFGWGVVRIAGLLNLVLMIITWLLFAPRIKRMVEAQICQQIAESTNRPAFLIAGQVMALGVAAYVMYSSLKILATFTGALSMPKEHTPEGKLQPTCQKDVDDRKAESNPWLDAPAAPEYLQQTRVSGMTEGQAHQKVENNLLNVNIMSTTGASIVWSNALMIQPGIALLPKHAFERMEWRKFPIHMVRKHNCPSSKMKCWIHNFQQVDESDFVLVQLSNVATFTNVIDLFPDEIWQHRGTATMLTRDKHGLIHSRYIYHKFKPEVNNGVVTWPGSEHAFHQFQKTAKGDCCSPVVASKKPHMIVGLHMGGVPDQPHGCSHQLTAVQIKRALSQFPDRVTKDGPVPVPMAQAGVLDLDRYGNEQKNFVPEFHERSVVNFTAEKDGHVPDFYPVGSLKQARAHYFSDVNTSPISELLEKRGRPQKWGPPKFASDRNHADSFQIMIHGEQDYPPESVDWAVKDYLEPVLEKVREMPPKFNQPLSLHDAINGVPGERFISKMNFSTSSGYGLRGKKEAHFENVGTEMDPVRIPSFQVEEEVHKVLDKYKTGTMDHPVARSALKDEPTKKGKTWVRVFNSLPLYNLLISRMYLLPIIAFINSFPLLCETAVGVNCTNDEWDELARWLREFEDYTCEGDYSKYDIRQNGQIIRAFSIVLLEIAREMGYSAIDLKVLETMFFDFSAACWMFNGSIFFMNGSWISGILITILMNGGGHSLRKRIFYHMTWKFIYITIPDPFRIHVHLITMGDDGAETTDLVWYNTAEMQKFFAFYSMPYTDAAKSEVAKPNVLFKDLAFCKRKFRYDERCGLYLAPIALDSIYKSLHCYMESKTPVDDIIIGNVDNALRELARHDEQTFNEERAVIYGVLAEYGMLHMSKYILTTYQEWGKILTDKNRSDEMAFDLVEDEGESHSFS